MDFEPTQKMREMQARLTEFMEAHIAPAEATFARHYETTDTPFRSPVLQLLWRVRFYKENTEFGPSKPLWFFTQPVRVAKKGQAQRFL